MQMALDFSILKNNKINLTDKLDLSSFAINKFFDIMYQKSALIKLYCLVVGG